MDIHRIVQIALIGEVPSTLRFLYSKIENNELSYHAVFTDDATEAHLECASVVLTEILSHYPRVNLKDKIERNSSLSWKQGNGDNLLYLRYGELSET